MPPLNESQSFLECDLHFISDFQSVSVLYEMVGGIRNHGWRVISVETYTTHKAPHWLGIHQRWNLLWLSDVVVMSATGTWDLVFSEGIFARGKHCCCLFPNLYRSVTGLRQWFLLNPEVTCLALWKSVPFGSSWAFSCIVWTSMHSIDWNWKVVQKNISTG